MDEHETTEGEVGNIAEAAEDNGVVEGDGEVVVPAEPAEDPAETPEASQSV